MVKSSITNGAALILVKEYAGAGSIPKTILMTSVSGKTKNGFTYEGDYEHANSDRVTWSATYRRDGHFYGMRHGRVNELMGVPTLEINDAVKDDIEATWTQSN